jgi:methylated-DNA-protein-cysteine methyltransferase-like protein
MTPAKAEKTYARIWAAVRRIPKGRVATYGQIAAAAGFPKQPRMAGYALHSLPRGSSVPWHRVINAQGRASFPPRSAPYREQRRRLEAEGVVFIGGRVNLARFGWQRSRESPLLD